MIGDPTQPESVGVTLIVPEIPVVPVFVAVNALGEPVPEAPKPMAVFVLVHANVAPAGVEFIVGDATAVPLHTIEFPGETMVGVGFTVMVNVDTGPTHVARVGVIETVAVTAVEPVLVAVKAGKLVVPEAASPIEVVLLVQANVAPVGVEANVFAATAPPLQIVILLSATTVGVGLTVIVNVETGPVQPFAEGVIEIVEVIAVVPALVAVKAGKLVVPDAAKPMDVFELVQENVVPATGLANVFAATAVPLHAVTFDSAVTVGVGLTVMVNV